MNMPNVVHPKTITVNGVHFRVVAYCQLTEKQALGAVAHHLRSHKGKAPKKGSVLTLYTVITAETAGLFG